jgi:lipid-binding SYLF domain-containing protein
MIVTVLASGSLAATAFARGPDESVRLADQVLDEIMSIPARRIPEQLLADAQGLVIIPSVIKVGFVGGIRRGRGVVLVRDADGAWGIPQFVVLTGGSVGWQAGVQATDVVLVFRTRRSVDGLLDGKFTLGAGASIAAGPVGRSAEAATDAQLGAEILSYSRSRGIFAGVAIDGSVIDIDEAAHVAFYGTPSADLPVEVPQSAVKLLQNVESLTHAGEGVVLVPDMPPAETAAHGLDKRHALARASRRLEARLNDEWRRYLALPKEVFADGGDPPHDSMRAALQRFDRTASDRRYQALTGRQEFRATHTDLRKYVEMLDAASPPAQIDLPPPPEESGEASRKSEVGIRN